MPDFMPGLQLAERFYGEAVRPILDREFSGLKHSAALIGDGSEVLGLDTPVSTDHHWGPRAMLFVGEDDHSRHAEAIHATLRRQLPTHCCGWSTSFTEPDPTDNGTQLLQSAVSGDVNHKVDVLTMRGFVLAQLGVDITHPMSAREWLTVPSQKLRSITAGAVFHDAIGLEALRARFAWYPHDVWLYLLAAGWSRIGQEEHLMGRAGQVGDEIGSTLIAARLVRDLMRLCFLMERRYAPYPKWLGTAFDQLASAGIMKPLLGRVLAAETWRERGSALAEAYAATADLHNSLALTDPLPSQPTSFHRRPFSVIDGERFARALRARISEPEVRTIPFDIGGVDQWSDSTELLETTALRVRLEALYRPPEGEE
jgi:hypothetical protein